MGKQNEKWRNFRLKSAKLLDFLVRDTYLDGIFYTEGETCSVSSRSME